MWIIIALLFAFLLPVTIYICYGALLWLLPKSKNKKLQVHSEELTQDLESLPKVSLVFPTHNEDKIIARRIKNVYDLDYPKHKLEIIIVDDASEDDTVRILEKLRRDNVKIIKHNARQGYNQAMITGVRHASGSIIAVTDAGTLQDKKALKRLVRHFVDPRIGGVTGRQALLDRRHGIGSKLEKDYSNFYNSMRKRESILDSTFDAKGEISAYRKEILEKTFDPRLRFMGTFDLYLGFFTRLCGFRVIYEEDAVFYEYAPYSIKDWFKQKINRAIIMLDTMSMFKNMIFNNKFGLFGLIILPFRSLILFLSPLFFCLSFVLAIYASIVLPSFATNFWIGLLITVAVLSLLISRHFVLTFSLSQLALVVALLRIMLGRKGSRVLWTQIPSTRGTHV